MTAIERTAYPRFRRVPSAAELHELYTPTAAELEFAARVARTPASRLSLLVLLKAFQRLGYFPPLDMVPAAIVAHIRTCLRLPPDCAPGYDSARTLYRHHRAIRTQLDVVSDGPRARHAAARAMARAAQTRDNPADSINAAIEHLVKERFELPAYSTLDRLARRVRVLVNGRLFAGVQARLAPAFQARLDALLVAPPLRRRTDFDLLKETPQHLSLSHMNGFVDRLAWLVSLGGPREDLAEIPPTKIKHFAAEARVLDADSMRVVNDAKRHTLLLCLLQQAQVATRDALVDMFIKRVARLHTMAKARLEATRLQQRATTEQLLEVLAEMLRATELRVPDRDGDGVVGTAGTVGTAEIVGVGEMAQRQGLPLIHAAEDGTLRDAGAALNAPSGRGQPARGGARAPIASAETAETADTADATLGRQIRQVLADHGGAQELLNACEALTAYHGNNYLPFLWQPYRAHRAALFRLLRTLDIRPTTQDAVLQHALAYVLEHEHDRHAYLPLMNSDGRRIQLEFASEQWQRLVVTTVTTVTRVHDAHRAQAAAIPMTRTSRASRTTPTARPDRTSSRSSTGSWDTTAHTERQRVLVRRHLELCVFTHVAAELKTGDLHVEGSEQYADYRAQLLPWDACAPRVAEYCRQVGLPTAAAEFVETLRSELATVAAAVDDSFPQNQEVTISEHGEPVLRRIPREEPAATVQQLEALLTERLRTRSVLDVLANVEHWTGWTRHFGPLSGSDPKLDAPTERYILTAFAYGCNLGPAQTARHTRGGVSAQQLATVNHRHITGSKLDASIRDIINNYARFYLPTLWGTGTAAAADGTKFDLYEENLLAEYHVRYGSYGGIAYHHVSDRYIALFTHFIACGVWEAVYILDGLLKNTSDLRPEILHADTQGQSTPVFALAHLLGIKLMPRIRNWKDLVFYRPSREAQYRHLARLFRDTIDWDLIATHWQDLLQVVLSIQAGTILPSTLLRKLNNYSRKNRLYQAFREVGRAVRTLFLLRYISDVELRTQITASTNKAEAYNGFTKWLFFGGEGVIGTNDPEEQEKRVKYTDVVANAVIFQNVVDMTYALRDLRQEGHRVRRETIAALSPYLTRHIRRFGDYVLDLSVKPMPLTASLSSPLAVDDGDAEDDRHVNAEGAKE